MVKETKKIASDMSKVSTAPSYLEWGPVWAGTVVAIAITTILFQFGASAGLALGEPVRADGGMSYNFIVAALWALLVAVASSAAAGYIAGRMRMTMNDGTENEVEFRDGVHGLTAWALATVIIGLIASLTSGIAAMAAASTAPVGAAEVSEQIQNWAANQTLIVAFGTAAGAALGAAAAWQASVIGGEHRNDGISFHNIVPVLLRRK